MVGQIPKIMDMHNSEYGRRFAHSPRSQDHFSQKTDAPPDSLRTLTRNSPEPYVY